eukprot:scaffold54339_cov17-Tisochrysis_lutea.AAC.2
MRACNSFVTHQVLKARSLSAFLLVSTLGSTGKVEQGPQLKSAAAQHDGWSLQVSRTATVAGSVAACTPDPQSSCRAHRVASVTSSGGIERCGDEVVLPAVQRRSSAEALYRLLWCRCAVMQWRCRLCRGAAVHRCRGGTGKGDAAKKKTVKKYRQENHIKIPETEGIKSRVTYDSLCL